MFCDTRAAVFKRGQAVYKTAFIFQLERLNLEYPSTNHLRKQGKCFARQGPAHWKYECSGKAAAAGD
jgi:hypothetical protein